LTAVGTLRLLEITLAFLSAYYEQCSFYQLPDSPFCVAACTQRNADSSLLYRLPPYSLVEQRIVEKEYHPEEDFIFAYWICDSEEPQRVDQRSLPTIESF
jgi:hypothetical protein